MFFPFHDDNPTSRTPLVTFALIGVNLLVFVATLWMPLGKRQIFNYQHGFVPARIAQLQTGKALSVPLGKPLLVRNSVSGKIHRAQPTLRLQSSAKEVALSLLTCMFLHGGWMHLITNMWFLWLFGNNVEDRLGHFLFVGLYLVGGLLASACHWAFGPGSLSPVIGASGAVATVLGAYAITWPWARVHTVVVLVVFITIIDIPALLVLGAWFVGQVFSAQAALKEGAAGGVAWWAHVGGFIAGVALMPACEMLIGLPKRLWRRRKTSSDRVS